jgi:hypothetical protein
MCYPGLVMENMEQAAGFPWYSDTARTFISLLSVTGTSYLTRNAIIEYTRTYKQVYNFLTL